MSRINAVQLESATGQTRAMFDAVQGSLGVVPNMVKVMANGPAGLSGYLQLRGALAGGSLSKRLQAQIALAVGQANGCRYCVGVHCVLGKGAGLGEGEVAEARAGKPEDAKERAVVLFVRQLVKGQGRVSDAEFWQLRGAGVTDGEVVEIIANVGMNMLTNYFNNVVGTEMDFPVAPAV